MRKKAESNPVRVASSRYPPQVLVSAGTPGAEIPPVSLGHPAYGIGALDEQPPVVAGSSHTAGEATADADHGDRFVVVDGDLPGDECGLRDGLQTLAEQRDQTVDGGCLPQQGRRQLPAQCVGELCGDHDSVAGGHTELCQRPVHGDVRLGHPGPVGDPFDDQAPHVGGVGRDRAHSMPPSGRS